MAEQRLSDRTAAINDLPLEDIDHLVYELYVHQIELELKNEKFQIAQDNLEVVKERYRDLFFYASLAYLEITIEQSLVIEGNRAAEVLPGVDSGRLPGSRLLSYSHAKTGISFTVITERPRKSVDKQNCEFRFHLSGGQTGFYPDHWLCKFGSGR